jgi:hypothetical protein
MMPPLIDYFSADSGRQKNETLKDSEMQCGGAEAKIEMTRLQGIRKVQIPYLFN